MENSNEISVTEALNHIQSWLNAGEFDKVIQGCQEILSIEPGNQRALSLLKQAEEKRHMERTGTPVEVPIEKLADPLEDLAVEEEPEDILQFHQESEDRSERKKLFLAMLVPAILVIILGGVGIWIALNWDREKEVEEIVMKDQEVDLVYLDENEERVETMQKITQVLEAYKVKNGAYPSATQIESALEDGSYFKEAPSDPRQGDHDKAGKPFGYVYAVYDGIGGENSIYIISAIFEDRKGFGYEWSEGAPIKNYPNYRELDEDNVTFIGGDE